MPVKNAPRKAARPPRRRTSSKAVPLPIEDIEESAPLTRPVEHNGVEIIHEERVPSPLPNGGAFKYNRIELVDGTSGYSCIDCMATTDTRGEIMAHRNATHGTRYGQKRPKVTLPEAESIVEVVLPEREEGPAPDSFYAMTLGEILSLAPSIHALGDLIDRVERERDEAVLAAADARVDKDTQRKIDVYETHRQEIIDLRLIVNRQKDYDALREEVVRLRSFRRKMIKRFEDVGFKMDEED